MQQTCDDEFSLRRLRGNFVRSCALVHGQVRLLDAAQNENERVRIRRQELNAIGRRQFHSVPQPAARFNTVLYSLYWFYFIFLVFFLSVNCTTILVN